MRAERERVNDMGLYILLAVLAVLVIFICILLIRAALAAKKAEPIGEKPVYTTEQEDIENGERLMKMIECQTVSSREIYDDREFAKLRAAVKELFPLLHERAEIKFRRDIRRKNLGTRHGRHKDFALRGALRSRGAARRGF